MATTKDPEAQELSHLVRNVIANLGIAFLEPDEKKFRCSLLLAAQDCFGKFTTAQIVRLYEAACDVKFATDDVKSFRVKLQAVVAKHHDLIRYRATRRATSTPTK
jgi:hypothetical protein